MAETNWTEMAASLDSNTVARGVTTGTLKPNSTLVNNFVFGFNSLLATEGAVGYYLNQANFNPLLNDTAGPTGGSIRGAMKRGQSGGATQIGFAPCLFFNLRSGISGGTPSVEDVGYLIGLEDSDPHRIILAKRSLRAGLAVGSSPDKSILKRSSISFLPDTWLHLRLDCIFNANGDVVLKVFRSDFEAGHTLEAPNWQPVPGMEDFIDDTIGVNTDSTPLSGGFAGWGFFSKDIQKRAYFDHIEILRQK